MKSSGKVRRPSGITGCRLFGAVWQQRPCSSGGPPCWSRLGSPSVGPDRYTLAMPKQRPFVVEIEAKLTVHAFDEDSARKKVEKAFTSGRVLGADVNAGARVWTYVVVPQQDAPGI